MTCTELFSLFNPLNIFLSKCTLNEITAMTKNGNNIFEGGFLGLDNIGIFDRSQRLPNGENLEQADGTSWMAMFSLNMMRIAMELALYNKVYG